MSPATPPPLPTAALHPVPSARAYPLRSRSSSPRTSSRLRCSRSASRTSAERYRLVRSAALSVAVRRSAFSTIRIVFICGACSTLESTIKNPPGVGSGRLWPGGPFDLPRQLAPATEYVSEPWKHRTSTVGGGCLVRAVIENTVRINQPQLLLFPAHGLLPDSGEPRAPRPVDSADR